VRANLVGALEHVRQHAAAETAARVADEGVETADREPDWRENDRAAAPGGLRAGAHGQDDAREERRR
jgi:hypothetical protein